MAAINETRATSFAISADADRLLTSISGDIAEVLLRLAETRAKSVMADGTRLVRVDDIKSAMTGISKALDEQVRLSNIDSEVAAAIKKLRDFYDSTPSEHASVRSSTPDNRSTG